MVPDYIVIVNEDQLIILEVSEEISIANMDCGFLNDLFEESHVDGSS